MIYIISNEIWELNTPPDSKLYDFIVLNEEQIAFYNANPNASVSEVLAMELNPIPEPQEPSNEPSLEE